MEWYERNKERFLLEVKLLKKYHPGARPVISNRTLYIFKKIIGKKSRYLIQIEYPKDFPYSPPRAHPIKPIIKGPHHQYIDGELCLYPPDEVGPQTSGKIICDWVELWIKAYEVWIASGKRDFPVPKDVEAKWKKLK